MLKITLNNALLYIIFCVFLMCNSISFFLNIKHCIEDKEYILFNISVIKIHKNGLMTIFLVLELRHLYWFLIMKLELHPLERYKII